MKAVDPGTTLTHSDSVEGTDVLSILLRAAAALRGRFSDFLERYGVTEGKYAILLELDVAGQAGLSQADVADRLSHSESNVSTLIDRLQHDGLVDRRSSETDRRKRVLLLTSSGRTLVEQVRFAYDHWSDGILSGFSVSDRELLAVLLTRISTTERRSTSRRMSVLARVLSTDSESKRFDQVEVPSQWATPAEIDAASPHSALARMLSTLGVADRFVEDVR